MNERAKKLVKYAKENRIPPPFAKITNEEILDAVDDNVDGNQNKYAEKKYTFIQAKPDLLVDSILQTDTSEPLVEINCKSDSNLKNLSPDDWPEKNKKRRKMTPSPCITRTRISSSSSSNSSSSSASTSSPSSPAPDDSSQFVNISTSTIPTISTDNPITDLVTTGFQSKVRADNYLIQGSESSTPKPIVANVDNDSKYSEGTYCEDFSPNDSGDEYRPEKRSCRKVIHRSNSSSTNSSCNDSANSISIFTQLTTTSQEETPFSIQPEGNNILYSVQNEPHSVQQSPKSIETNDQSHVAQNTLTANRKRKMRHESDWKKEKAKNLKNSGQQYTSRTGRTFKAKEIKPTCTDKCRYACSKNFSEEQRLKIFEMYWALGTLQRQRDFLNSTITVLQPVQRRLKLGVSKTRKPNTYYSLINEGKSSRVCKTFLLNTLDIADRTLRTVIENRTANDSLGNAPCDKRGKHDKHSKVDPEILESVRNHIKSINRIESHYLRAHTTREYIDGGLTIADLHRDYEKMRDSQNKAAASYDLYFRIFNGEFNISFFIPKKDQCDVCESYKNAAGVDKEKLEVHYREHLQQKELSRAEKTNDIELCQMADNNNIVAIYDLQAVMPVPVGDSSAFFYKSKLNCLNLTMTDMRNKQTVCYFWHEALGNRGANEIGSCVFKFLENVANKHPGCDVIFYTDNCGGQQKNRYIFSMYLYAVSVLSIKSITHKFLIRGHTQNEGDTAHSIIEKSMKKSRKSGPIYVPDQYVQIIRSAKKSGKPFLVQELNYDDFYDLKKLSDSVGMNMAKDHDGNTIKTNDIRMIRFRKDSTTFSYKTKYEENWIQAEIKTKRARTTRIENYDIKDVSLEKAYSNKIEISQNKKKDLQELLQKNIIPRFYSSFYESIFN